MKRLLRAAAWFLVLALLGLGGCTADREAPAEDAAVTAPTSTEPFWVGTVWNCEYVNLRLGPSSEDRILDFALAGTMLRLASPEPQDGWYQVIAHGDTAYVTQDYISVSQWLPGTAVRIGVVTDDTGDTDLHKEASSASSCVWEAAKYQQLLVLSEAQDGFYAVDYGGDTLYVADSCLTVTPMTIEKALF